MNALQEAGPRLVVLLVSSPLIGAAIVALLGRARPEAARQAALANGLLTVLFGGLLTVVFATAVEHSPSAQSVLVPWFTVAHSTPGDGSRPTMICVLSFGVDALNLGPLTWIPWLAGGAIGMKSREDTGRQSPASGTRAGASTGKLVVWLLIEAGLLAVFAAQDAVTFAFAGMVTLGLIGLNLGWWGDSDRRAAAGRFLRGQFAAQLLWWLGLVGMAVAAAWSRQELLARIPPVDFRWITLSRGLPQVVYQSMAGFQYWSAASPLLFAVLLTGAVLRTPWAPFHHGMQTWLNAVPTSSALLLIGAWPLVAGYGWLRFIAPAFGEDLAALDGLLTWWTAISAILCSRLCWTATEPRQFATAWCLSLQSLGWLGLVDGTPAGLTAGWLMLQAAGWSAAGWLLLGERAGDASFPCATAVSAVQSSQHGRALARLTQPWHTSIPASVNPRRPRAALTALLCLSPLVAIPVVGGGPESASPVEVLLLHHLWPTGLAIVGWFVTGWAAMRRIAHLAFGKSPMRAGSDLAWRDGLWLLPLAVCQIVVVAHPALWWGQP
ncbi:MAG TPA: hypothetical protein VM165_01465 [Planctomycetaceae bacterium]|nr:hypothetical protein [Planctomycetaceae bacterium]